MEEKFSLSRYLTEAYIENQFIKTIWDNCYGNPTFDWKSVFDDFFSQHKKFNNIAQRMLSPFIKKDENGKKTIVFKGTEFGNTKEIVENANKEAEKLQEQFSEVITKGLIKNPDSIEINGKSATATDENVGRYTVKDIKKLGFLFTNAKNSCPILWCAGPSNPRTSNLILAYSNIDTLISNYTTDWTWNYSLEDWKFLKMGVSNRTRYKVYEVVDVTYKDGSKGKLKLMRQPFIDYGQAYPPYKISQQKLGSIKKLSSFSWGEQNDDYALVLFSDASTKKKLDDFLAKKTDTMDRYDVESDINPSYRYDSFGKYMIKNDNKNYKHVYTRWKYADGKARKYYETELYSFNQKIAEDKNNVRKAIVYLMNYIGEDNNFDISETGIKEIIKGFSDFSKEVYEKIFSLDLSKSTPFLNELQTVSYKIENSINEYNNLIEKFLNSSNQNDKINQDVLKVFANLIKENPKKYINYSNTKDLVNALKKDALETSNLNPILFDYFYQNFQYQYNAIKSYHKDLSHKVKEIQNLTEKIDNLKKEFAKLLEDSEKKEN